MTARLRELECRPRNSRIVLQEPKAVPDEPTEKPETPETSEPAREPEDAMSPEAIAKRVAALGGEDEVDRLARDEELKLAERRAKAGGGVSHGC